MKDAITMKLIAEHSPHKSLTLTIDYDDDLNKKCMPERVLN